MFLGLLCCLPHASLCSLIACLCLTHLALLLCPSHCSPSNHSPLPCYCPLDCGRCLCTLNRQLYWSLLCTWVCCVADLMCPPYGLITHLALPSLVLSLLALILLVLLTSHVLKTFAPLISNVAHVVYSITITYSSSVCNFVKPVGCIVAFSVPFVALSPSLACTVRPSH